MGRIAAWGPALLAVLLSGCWQVCAAQAKEEWGLGVSREECRAQSESSRLQDILEGNAEPYAFTGPRPECSTEGCRHKYWGSRCRWEGLVSPACPEETRAGLVQLLKDYAGNGAGWASSALTLQPCQMWEAIRGRTVWFVGDSISQETGQALVCFIVEYFVTGRHAPPISEDSQLMYRLTHNANNIEMTTWCLLFEEETRICMLRANFGPRMASVILPALGQVTDPQDILVINFGLWSNSMDELKLHVGMFEAAFEYHRHSLPNRTFWRETSAQHYSTLNGMYDTNTPITQQTCRPIFPGTNLTIAVNGSLIVAPGAPLPQQWSLEDWEMRNVLRGGYRNAATQPVADKLGLHTIRIWNTSLPLWNFHHHVHLPDDPQACAKIECDCTHACHPSWPQLWLPEFLKAFADERLYMQGGKQ